MDKADIVIIGSGVGGSAVAATVVAGAGTSAIITKGTLDKMGEGGECWVVFDDPAK